MIQYFLENLKMAQREPITVPRLVYFCNTGPAEVILPRAMHRHKDRLEIVFITAGSGSHVIGSRAYETQKGDILVFNSDTLHDEVSHPDSTLNVYCCGLSGVQLPGLPPDCLLPAGVSPVLHSGSYETAIAQLFQTMERLIIAQSPRAREVCEHLIGALLGIVCEMPVENEVTDEDYVAFSHIRQYFDTHFSEDISVSTAAKKLRISESYLSHTFKKVMGYSPIQYLIRRRIGEAQTLLINTDDTVTRIAAMVGYDNSNYFTTLFAKVTGMTPVNYRQYWISHQMRR